MPSTPTIAREKRKFMPLDMQFTAFGPGVVTNTTQNSANMVQDSKLMASIHRWGDNPDRHRWFVIRVGPAVWFAADAKAVTGMDGKGMVSDIQI